MTKILHLTDIHIKSTPLVPSLPRLPSPVERLRACVRHILAHHADADLCLVTGDLVQEGDEPSYRVLQQTLQTLPMPVALLMGNHDALPNLRVVFPNGSSWYAGEHVQGHDFLQYTVEHLPTRIICLDTFDPERKAGGDGSGGRLCQSRLDWLEARLGENTRPTLIAMHHQPLILNMPYMDSLRLEDSEALAAVIARHPHVRHICFGHVHRCVAGQWAGASFSSPGSIGLPVCFDSRHETFIALSDESPAYGVMLIDDAPAPDRAVPWSLAVHRVPFMPEETWLLP